jgi:TolB protein
VTADEEASNIFTLCEDGTGLLQLTTMTSSNNRPAWSPDGSRLVFESLRTGDFDIWTMAADGSDLRNLTATEPDPDMGRPHDEHGAWSPGGEWVAFTSSRTGEGDIYVVRADGSELRRLTTDPFAELYPTWSPDGTRIAFERIGIDGGDLLILDVATGAVTILTDFPGHEEDPQWSPDGTLILFSRSMPLLDRAGLGPADLWVVEPDGSGLRNLTNSPSTTDYDPAWHPDAMRIAFVSHRQEGVDLYTLQLESGEVAGIGLDASSSTGPSWRR